MQAYTQALETLLDQATRFARDPKLKLLHVIASADMRSAAVDVVMAQEFRLDNRSPYVSFEQPYLKADDGWPKRVEHARRQHDDRREKMAEAGETLPALTAAPKPDAGLTGFAQQVGQLDQARPAETSGLVVVMAPDRVEDVRAWAEALQTLIVSRELASARWVVIDVERSTVDPLVASLQARALQVRCTVDPKEAGAAMQAKLDEVAPGPKGVTPPTRKDEPQTPEPTPESIAHKEMRSKTLGAAQAMQAGRMAAAVRSQREARDLAGKLGLGRVAVTMETMLGAYLGAAGEPKAAEASYDKARQEAAEAGALDQVATARFAQGAGRMARRDPHAALVAYADGAVAAEKSENPTLAIEGCRVTGQLASDLRMEAQAITFWSKGIQLADGLGPEVSLTSAPIVARSLAAICRKRSMSGRAAQLEAKAAQYESVEIPEPQAPAAPTPEAEAPEPEAPAKPKPELPPIEAPAFARPAAQPPAEQPALVRPSAPPPDQPAFARPPAQPQPGQPAFARPPAFAQPPAAARGAPASPPTQFLDDASPFELSSNNPNEGEGTDLLSLEELAAIHWGGAVPVGADGRLEPPLIVDPATGEATGERARLRFWEPDELSSIHASLGEVMNEETTGLLSVEELQALRAGPPNHPVPSFVPPAYDVASGEGTPELTSAQLEQMRAGTPPSPAAAPRPASPRPASPPPSRPPPPTPSTPDVLADVDPAKLAELRKKLLQGGGAEETTMMTKDDIARLAKSSRDKGKKR